MFLRKRKIGLDEKGRVSRNISSSVLRRLKAARFVIQAYRLSLRVRIDY